MIYELNHNRGSNHSSIYVEVDRKNLIGKVKKQSPGRYSRRVGYKPLSFRSIGFDSLFKKDEFVINIPVGDYICTIAFKGLMEQLKYVLGHQPKPNLTLQTVIKAIARAIDAEDILVDCTCPDFCLHEDTELKLLNGQVVTVKDLLSKFNNNEELWVYSTDSNGDFKPGRVTDVWVSGYVSKMIKITLDNGESIETTPNHRYMLRDGSYIEAENLNVGQSLMPLYFSYHNGYESVKLNSTQKSFVSVYKTVANELLSNEIAEAINRSREDIIAIHHSDFNKLNNYPSNLKPMGKVEHWRYHASHAMEDKERLEKFVNAGHEYWRTSEGRLKKSLEMSQSIRNFWNDMTEDEKLEYIKKSHAWMYTEEGHNKLSEGLKKYWNSLNDKEKSKRNAQNSISLNGVNGRKSSEIKKKWWENASDDQLIKMREVQSSNGKKVNENITDKMKSARSNNCKIAARKKLINNGNFVINSIIEKGLIVSEETYNKFRRSGDPKYSTVIDLGLLESYNHKISKIEFVEYKDPIPVYDLTVDKYNNFFVNAGVILHNCYRFAYWATKYGYKYGKPENRPAKITNPNDKLGAMCKHLTSILSNKKWTVKVASVLNEFIKAYPNEVQELLGLNDDEFIINDPKAKNILNRKRNLKKATVIDKDDPEELEPIDSDEDNEESDEEDSNKEFSNTGDDSEELEINDEDEDNS